MKHLHWIFALFIPSVCFAQGELPFYYEQNLPLYGHPSGAEEFYYEYHTQAKAHYYSHHMAYDPQGRIKTHVKTNVGLLDSIPLTFQDIIDLRPITITNSFDYDLQDRLAHFVRQRYQEEVGTFQQDEIWKYDDFGMLAQHLFLEVNGTDTLVKNPSMKRVIYRDAFQKVLKIEKYAYSFTDKGLVLTESASFGYAGGVIDTISIFQISNEGQSLKEKRYGLAFYLYNDRNTDSLLLVSYTSKDAAGGLTQHGMAYDNSGRILHHQINDSTGANITQTNWKYDTLKITESTDGHYRLEVYTDETGYERYREEFENDHSLAVPADLNTRTLKNGRIEHALLEIWDPVTLFYRKDTEYFYSYDDVTALPPTYSSTKRIQVYPNPSTGTIHLPDISDIERLELVSAEGRTEALPLALTLELDVPKGIYLLRMAMKDQSIQVKKLIVE